jgi:hypothetical protein
MADQNDILRSAQNIVSNMEDLVNDIENLDEHNHDAWDCTECESMIDEAVQEKVGELDVNDLMDANYSLWQDIGEEAVGEYKERTEEVSAAIDELVQRVVGLYSTVENTDVNDVTEAINYITEKVYGVRDQYRQEYNVVAPQEDIVEITLNVGDDAPKDSLTLDNKKCSCGIDHSATNYGEI